MVCHGVTGSSAVGTCTAQQILGLNLICSGVISDQVRVRLGAICCIASWQLNDKSLPNSCCTKLQVPVWCVCLRGGMQNIFLLTSCIGYNLWTYEHCVGYARNGGTIQGWIEKKMQFDGKCTWGSFPSRLINSVPHCVKVPGVVTYINGQQNFCRWRERDKFWRKQSTVKCRTVRWVQYYNVNLFFAFPLPIRIVYCYS